MALTAQAVVDRIRQAFGPGWKDSAADAFFTGDPQAEVTGVATCYAPTLDVLRKAVANRQNMIITRESPFWARGAAAANANARRVPAMDGDPTYQYKRDYIAANTLIIYRLFDNWNARQPDGQLQGLAKALGWEKNYTPSGGQAWETNNCFFELQPATLKDTAIAIKKQLGAKSIRVGGNPNLRVTKAALSHGMYWLTDIQKMLAEPGVDLMVVGEPQWENELSQYSFDLADSGARHGMIVLGQEVSEDPGCGEMAAWLKGVVREVPVSWIPAGEPCWMPY
jgi:putative NIF3 family GTP cyclohydrolase 1 type 2